MNKIFSNKHDPLSRVIFLRGWLFFQKVLSSIEIKTNGYSLSSISTPY